MGLTLARPEREIQRACLDLLEVMGLLAWRANTGAIQGTYKGRDRFVRFGFKGQSDILGAIPPSGRLLAVEVKRPGGRLSVHQDAFLQAVVRAGGIGLVVTSPAELREKLARYLPGRTHGEQ